MPRKRVKSDVDAPELEQMAAGDKSEMAAALQSSADDAPALEPVSARAESADPAGAPALPPELLEAAEAERYAPAPTVTPPSEAEILAAEAEGVAAWHNSKKITALWSNDSNRNSYIAVSGMGWKKLSNANDSSVVSMTMLAAHAEQTNANVNLRIESDGMVHELYVW